jgi:hypothetical protein
MNTKSMYVLNQNLQDINELNVIDHYPIEDSLEMVYLLRRISVLKSIHSQDSILQYDCLSDVVIFEEFIKNILSVRNITLETLEEKIDSLPTRESFYKGKL